MNKKILMPVALGVVVLCACKMPKSSVKAEPYRELITDTTTRKIIKDKELYAATTEVIAIDSAYIENGRLHVVTAKMQACDEDNFNMVWNGAMAKSLPPQTTVKLLLLTDPACKEQHKFHLSYQLKPLQLSKDSTGKGTTMVRVAGFKAMLPYNY